jgi:precorrin-6B methylase 2
MQPALREASGILASVTLCDVDRLRTLDPLRIQAFSARLRAADMASFASRLARSGRGLDDALRAPVRIWHARRSPEPAAILVRLFMLRDPIAPEDAVRTLGDLAALRDAGLLEDSAEGLVSRAHLALAADVPCFGDPPGSDPDAVMPMGGATLELIRALVPRAVNAALDVGCGAGSVALHLARAGTRVVATDIDPRALSWARFNADLNGIDTIDFRCGDLFEPVRGERFDRIAAHPPFMACAHGESRSTFVHGGPRGDELAQRLLQGAPAHLTDSGRLVMVADWPVVTGDPLAERMRARLGHCPVGLLILQSPTKNLDEYCALCAAVECAGLGPEFVQSALRKRDHYERLGISSVTFVVVVVEASKAAWTSLVPVRHPTDAPVTAEGIERLLATHALAHLGDVGRARLRLPEGTALVLQPLPDGSEPAVIVRLPASRPEWPPVLDASTASLVHLIAQAPSVGHAAEQATSTHRDASAFEADDVLRAAREALRRGVLEPH